MSQQLCTLDDKGKIIVVAEVLCNPTLRQAGNGEKCSIKLVCDRFTRDPSMLALGDEERDDGSGQAWGAANSQTQHRRMILFADDAKEKSRIMGFGEYLRERKKAALCRHGEEDIVLLPPSKAQTDMITCYSIPRTQMNTQKRNSVPPIQNFQGAGKLASVQEQHGGSTKPSEKRQKPSLLASLAKRTTSATGIAARKAQQAKLAKAQVSSYIDKIEKDVHSRVEAFANDPTLNEIRMEAMDKDYRYVVHDVITQYPELVSASVGDMEDRHCVIYRRGFQPNDVEIHVSPAEIRQNSVSNKPVSKVGGGIVGPGAKLQAKAIASAAGADLVTLNTEKKDRRTIEELKRDGVIPNGASKRDRDDGDNSGQEDVKRQRV